MEKIEYFPPITPAKKLDEIKPKTVLEQDQVQYFVPLSNQGTEKDQKNKDSEERKNSRRLDLDNDDSYGSSQEDWNEEINEELKKSLIESLRTKTMKNKKRNVSCNPFKKH